jgi:hypothetical protein
VHTTFYFSSHRQAEHVLLLTTTNLGKERMAERPCRIRSFLQFVVVNPNALLRRHTRSI